MISSTASTVCDMKSICMALLAYSYVLLSKLFRVTYTSASHKHVHGRILKFQTPGECKEEGTHQEDQHMIYTI